MDRFQKRIVARTFLSTPALHTGLLSGHCWLQRDGMVSFVFCPSLLANRRSPFCFQNEVQDSLRCIVFGVVVVVVRF